MGRYSWGNKQFGGTAMKKLAVALAIGLSAAGTAALAQDKPVDLKISNWLPPAHPLVPATKAWAEDIENASGVTIKTAIFPSEHLGKPFAHYNMAPDCLPIGFHVPFQPRQGHAVPHGRAALFDRVHLFDQQGEVRFHVGGAEEGDRL